MKALVLTAALLGMPTLLLADEPLPRPVKLMRFSSEPREVSRRFLGRVTARSTVDMAFRSAGQIVEFPVIEGQRVAEGEMLAQLGLGPFERAVAQARAELNKAERDLARSEQLGADVVAGAQIEAQRTSVELAQVAYQEALDALENATMTAPFDALVARQMAEQYATVGAGQAVVRLHDVGELRVEIDLPELLIRPSAGRSGIVAHASLPGIPEAVPLFFREITAEASDVGQTYTVSFAFGADQPLHVLPGASATVTAILRQETSSTAPVVPPTAVRYDADGAPQLLVYVPGEDPDIGRLRAHPVEIEPGPDGDFAVTGGPDEGAEIVAAGAAMLQGGEAVRRYLGTGASR